MLKLALGGTAVTGLGCLGLPFLSAIGLSVAEPFTDSLAYLVAAFFVSLLVSIVCLVRRWSRS